MVWIVVGEKRELGRAKKRSTSAWKSESGQRFAHLHIHDASCRRWFCMCEGFVYIVIVRRARLEIITIAKQDGPIAI